ncbi:MAG TPA: HK97 family phage prohead protease [Phycisphaerae bacterium]|nr:HK97 family phage prohead protease [Phycisphaerae bacterium]
MERRFTSAPGHDVMCQRAEGEPATISGYAAVFYDGTPRTEYPLWEGAVERILPGAFDRALKEDDIRALFNHDPSAVLGRSAAGTLVLSIDATGLAYRIDAPDTQVGRDVSESVRRRDVTGSSFAFMVTDQEWRTENSVDIREVKGVRLFDVGPVTYPAYTATTVGARSAPSAAEPDEARASFEAHKAARIAAVHARTAARVRAVECECRE